MPASIWTQALILYGAWLPNHPRKWWIHPKLREALRVSVKGERQVTRGGRRWLLDPSDYAHADLFWLGTKDRWELYHLRRRLSPDAIVVDAGANFGYIGVSLAVKMRSKARVHALEPNPRSYVRLTKTIELNNLRGLVEPYPVGLSDVGGRASMAERGDNSGASRIVDPGLGADVDRLDVDLVTMDDFCSAHRINRLDGFVLDVEGYEERTLRGAAGVLNRCQPLILLKVWATALEQAGSSLESLQTALRDHDYRCYRVKRRSLIPIVQLPNEPYSVWVLCFHSRRNAEGSG